MHALVPNIETTSFFCIRYNVRWNTMFLCLAKASSSKDEIRSQKSNQIKGCKTKQIWFCFCGSADSQNFQFFTTDLCFGATDSQFFTLNNIDSQKKSRADKWKCFWCYPALQTCLQSSSLAQRSNSTWHHISSQPWCIVDLIHLTKLRKLKL
jgi:hypothetical protein